MGHPRFLMLLQVVQRILCHAVISDLKVAMVAGGIAGRTHLGNLLAFVDMLSHRNQELAVMAITGNIAVAMVDLYEISVAAHPPGVDDRAAIGRVDRRTVAVGNINALMVGGTNALSLIHI